MRIQLNENWRVRPTQDGLELMAPEHNITLELSDLVFRDEIEAVLVGNAEIPVDNKVIEETLQLLKNIGAISAQEGFTRQNPSSTKREEAAWRIRRDFVGPRGPIMSVYWLNPSQSKLSLSRTHLFTAKYRERTGHGEEMREAWASGSDADWGQAEFKAIMEALERHACGIIPQEQLVRSTARKLKNQALDPRRIVVYTKAQYKNNLPFVPFSKDREYWWKSVKVSPEGYEKYVPIECLYYPAGHELSHNLYTAANSSGVAAGLTFEDALLRGIYEAIERDAFMITWLIRASMPLIDQRTISEECRERVYSLESLGYRMYFVDITLELAPVVLAVGVSEKVRPSLVIGAASNPDIEKAVEKSLSEVEHQLYWEWRDPENIHSISDPTEVNKIPDHTALYASSEHLSKAVFLWGGETRPMNKSNFGIQDTSAVMEKLKQHGFQTAVLDLTPEYLKKTGVYVVRVIPLGLIPISFGYGMEPLGMARYTQMAKRGNPWPGPVPFPHPFS
ncbi:MAG: YcaO-like family protein [Patescibacteria group bacterium]